MKLPTYIAVILVLASCQSIERTPKPHNLIPKDKMVDLLYDMTLLDASKRLNRVEVNLDRYDIRAFIYEKYSVDSAQLANSNAYYTEDLKTYKAIIDSVKTRLDTLKIKLDTLVKVKKRKEDSIAQAKKDSIAQIKNNTLPDKSKLKLNTKNTPEKTLKLNNKNP